MANENMIKFLRGNVANLPQTATAGALYFTKDEGIYMGMEDGSYHRYGEFIVVTDVESLPASGAHNTCMYYCAKENILAKYDSAKGWVQINKQPTADEMKTLLGLGTLAYKSVVVESDLSAELAEKVNAAAEGNHAHSNKGVIDGITSDKVSAWDASEQNAKDYADGLNTAMNGRVEALEAIDHEHANKALLDTYTQTEANLADAVAKKHSHTFVESELNKIVAGDVAKWNGVVADHLTAADKTAIEDSIGDVNTALENYKTSNNEALAGVKATAEAAATKEYADAELAKKVAKTDYEADKATFATKTDIAKLAGVSEGANKVEASANNGSIKIDGVETVVYTHPDKHAIGDVTGLQDALDAKVVKTDYEADKATFATKTELGNVDKKFENYVTSASYATDKSATETALANRYTKEEADGKFALIADAYDDTELAGRVTTAEGKIADLETESAKHALKTDVEAVDAKFANYTKTADLPTDLGDFTNNAGYAKTADVNVELDKKADKTQVATDIANAIAPLATTEALNGVKEIAEAARTEDEVNSQIDTKITALNLGTTYEPIGAETRAKAYADGLISDANLDQYTTEQEVKDIVDTVITNAVDGDTITGLANLVEYLNTHGAEAKEMGAAIDVLEGKVETIEGKPAYGITATQVSNWDNEVGAKALAETKLDASVFTEYSNAHAGDYTNKQIDDAIDADVKAAIDAEVLRANGAYDAKGAAADAQAAAEATAAGALASARTEITTEIGTAISGEVSRADGKYEEKGVAQGIVDALKLAETYEPIGAETRAIAAAESKVNTLADNVYAKTETYNKSEIETLLTWGSF